MKKALMMLLTWVLWLIAGVGIGTFFYSLHLHSLSLIAGRSSAIFTKENIFVSFVLVTQIMTFVIGFLLLAFKIRHQGNPLQLVAFIICQFLSFCAILPLTYHFERKFLLKNLSEIEIEESTETLSAGFFRESESMVYYFLDEDNKNVIRIDTSDGGSSEVLNEFDVSDFPIVKNSHPYKDILIKNTFTKQAQPTEYSFFGTLLMTAKRDLNLGWTFWLGFLSLALALTAIYPISGISAWRISNYSICALLYGVILFVNGFYWAPAFNNFRNMAFMKNRLFTAMSAYVSSPFLVFVNLIITLIFSVLGIVLFIVHKKRGRR